jgi:hypothetical protein
VNATPRAPHPVSCRFLASAEGFGLHSREGYGVSVSSIFACHSAMKLIQSLDALQIIIVVIFLLAPAISPLWTRKSAPPTSPLGSAIRVAVAKVGLAAVVVALVVSPFTMWVAQLVGWLISAALFIAFPAGLLIFIFAGFWTAGDDGWRVMKWAAIGAAIFLFAASLKLHPFEIAKEIESAFSGQSDE